MPSDNPQFPLRTALDSAGPKPDPTAEQAEKKNYAQRLSNQLALTVADGLRSAYREFAAATPTSDGRRQEAAVGSSSGRKRLDVGVMDPAVGLILGVSIKTYSFEDYSPKQGKLLGRWTKNAVRNDHELGAEATVLHRRQPYAVLAAIMFQPVEIFDSAAGKPKSSFAHHADILAKRTGRGRRPIRGIGQGAFVEYGGEDPRLELFERVWIGLYESSGEQRGAVSFFDVERQAPRVAPPGEGDTTDFTGMLAVLKEEVDRRDRKAPDFDDSPDELLDGDDA